MRIEHIAMYVQNLEAAKSFFEKYFGGKANLKYANPRTGFSSYFISFSDGSRLELMNSPLAVEQSSGEFQAGYVHIAFSVGSKDGVNELTEWLRADGYRVASEARTTGDGYYESCVLDGENNRIEITI